MAQTAPFSIRLSDEHATAIADIMASTGLKKGPAIAHLLGLGIDAFREADKPATKAEKVVRLKRAIADIAPAPGKPAPKPEAVKSHVGKDGIQIGPVDPPAGSRLKTPPAKRERWK